MGLQAALRCPHCGATSDHDLRAVLALGHAVCQSCKKSFEQFPEKVRAQLKALAADPSVSPKKEPP